LVIYTVRHIQGGKTGQRAEILHRTTIENEGMDCSPGQLTVTHDEAVHIDSQRFAICASQTTEIG
jgi:hypothetical protein